MSAPGVKLLLFKNGILDGGFQDHSCKNDRVSLCHRFGQSIMGLRGILRGHRVHRLFSGGFNLLELLAVIGIIAILAALLLPAWSRGKARAQTAVCRSQLRQIGLTMTLYLSESRHYPPMWDVATSQLWVEKLYPNQPRLWTNASWNCPAYVASGRTVGWFEPDEVCISYAYNWRGTALGWKGRPKGSLPPPLGLGHLSKDEVLEPEVASPSEMFAVTDARVAVQPGRVAGNPKMMLWKFAGMEEAAAPHLEGYCVLFADGHALWLKRRNYLFPPLAARNWNRDNQLHLETWAPQAAWTVTE